MTRDDRTDEQVVGPRGGAEQREIEATEDEIDVREEGASGGTTPGRGTVGTPSVTGKGTQGPGDASEPRDAGAAGRERR